ncbi:MAG: hypothetical protein WAM11_11910 [Cyanobium sp.]
MAPPEQRHRASDPNPADRASNDRFRGQRSAVAQRSVEGQPLWLAWLQLGISTMLVVLFLVILGKVREQATTVSELEQKLRTIENARSQDRTTAMEQQLEAMIQRLQSVEKLSDQLRNVDRQQQAIKQDLQKLRHLSPLALDEPGPGLAPPPRAQSLGRPSTLPNPPAASATPLRPPTDNP